MSGSCGVISVEYCELLDGGVQKKKLDADDVTTSKRAKITKFCKINRMSFFTATLCLHLSMTFLNV